jgi:zinc protease
VRPVVTDDYFGICFSLLSKNFDPAFNLLQEMIKTPGFEKELVDREKDLQKAEILVQRNSEAYAGQLINQVLFKSSAYSLDVNGTEESLPAISLESLQGWYETYVKNRKPVVVIIGDTKGTSLASNFVQHFSGSRIQETKIASEPVKAVEKGESIVTKWDKDEDLIWVGFQAPAVDDEDRYAATVIENYSGGLGKFSQEITERQGTAIDISADYAPRLRGGSFVFSTAPAGASDETVLKVLLEQIQQLTSAPILYRDFRAAVNEAVGNYWIRGQERFLQIEDVVDDLLAGRGIDGYQNFASDLQQVTQEEFEDVAGRFFKTEKAVVVRMQRK